MTYKEMLFKLSKKFDKYTKTDGEISFFKKKGLFTLKADLIKNECYIWLLRNDSDIEYILLFGIDFSDYSSKEVDYIIKKCLKILELTGDLL